MRLLRTSFAIALLLSGYARADEPATAHAESASPAVEEIKVEVQPDVKVDAVPRANNASVPATARQIRTARTASIPPEDAAQHLSMVLQVESDNDQTQFRDSQGAIALLTSTALIDAAIDASLQVDPDQRRKLVLVNASPAGFRFTRLEVTLRKSDSVKWKPDDAQKLAAALCDQLKIAFETSTRAAAQFQQLRQKELQQKIDAVTTKLAELRKQLREYRDALGVSYNEGSDPQYAIRNLRQQKQSMEMELAQFRARLEEVGPATAPAAAEWQQVVELRQERLEELKKAAKDGKDVTAEMKTLQEQLVEARAKLADAKRTDLSEQRRTGRFNEGHQLTRQISEMETRLGPILESIAKLEDPKVQQMSDQIPELTMQEQRLRGELQELHMRGDQIRLATQWEPKVQITVFDGKPPAKPTK